MCQPLAKAVTPAPQVDAAARDMVIVAAFVLVLWGLSWLWHRGWGGQLAALFGLVVIVAVATGPLGSTLYGAAQGVSAQFGQFVGGKAGG